MLGFPTDKISLLTSKPFKNEKNIHILLSISSEINNQMFKENLVPLPKNLPNKDLDFLRNLTSPHTFKETPIP